MINFRSNQITGLTDVNQDFKIKFINLHGNFSAVLEIDIPTISIAGKYNTNLTQTSRGTLPNLNFTGEGDYTYIVKSMKMRLSVNGRAPMIGRISIDGVNFTYDHKSLEASFSNMTMTSSRFIKGWTWYWLDWKKAIHNHNDIPKSFGWNLLNFYINLKVEQAINEAMRCVLDNIFNVILN